MNPLFTILIGEEFEALSHEDLSAYRDALRATAERVYARDPEVVAELSPSDLIAEMRSGVEAIEAANERLTALEAEAAATEEPVEIDAELEQLAVQARGETEPVVEETIETPGEEPEPLAAATEEPEAPEATEPELEATEPEPETVIAATEPPAEEPKPLARPARSRASKPVEAPVARRASMTAACEGLPGLAIGAEFEDELALAAAMISKRFRFGNMTAREDVPIASYDWREDYPEERRLDPRGNGGANEAKVNALLAAIASDKNKGTDKALVAAGGICAPVTPLYDLPVFSVDVRPVRAALPAFLAERGGIQFATPPTLGDVDTAVGIITAVEDGLGGTSATKTCQVLECPDFNEVDVDILYHCVQTSNLTYRTYPEQLAQFNRLVLAAFARMAEGKLLDEMKSASTAVSAASSGLGAVGDLLSQILTAASGMRSRHRMNPDAVLRVMLPRWSTALMVSDVIRSQFQRFDTDEARITALLRTFNVEPSFYIDEATGDSQVFGAQSASDLLPFPADVDWLIYPEGTFLYLDGGTLELGLVRDSVLNSTNEFQIFGESFENVAMVGIESLYVTSTVCDSGIVAAPGSVTCGDYS